MPYTLSHAVVSLPVAWITRYKIPLSALIVGSISPDIPYILALTPTHAPGHSMLGVLSFCLIPSLGTLFVWHRWLEAPTLELFGLSWKSRTLNWRNFCLSSIGVLIGAYSHVLWDATSHADGAFVVNSDFWRRTILSLPLYKWNQYVSGIAGLVIIVVWYLRSVLKERKNLYKGHLLPGLVTYTVCIAFFILLANVLHSAMSFYDIVIRSSVGFMAGGLFATCVYSLIVNWRKSG